MIRRRSVPTVAVDDDDVDVVVDVPYPRYNNRRQFAVAESSKRSTHRPRRSDGATALGGTSSPAKNDLFAATTLLAASSKF